MRNGVGNTREQGFTLIEVLVAVIILGIGLLGIAQMQALSLAYNHSSELRSQAILQAYDISERIRANPSVDYSAQSAQDNNCAATPTNSSPSSCSATAMAQNDLYEWNQENANRLPSGTGTIQKNGSTYLITVNWKERSKQGVVSKAFKLSFQP